MSFCSGSNSEVPKVGRSIYNGMTASELYANEKGVSPVDRCGVVL